MYTQEQLELLDKVEALKKEKNLSQNAVGQLIGCLLYTSPSPRDS